MFLRERQSAFIPEREASGEDRLRDVVIKGDLKHSVVRDCVEGLVKALRF
jgi:hypothetical protein